MQRPFRVIETGWYGAYAGRVLADLGFDVIWLEPTGGSDLRRQGPHPLGPDGRPDRAGPGVPARFLAAGKRSVCVSPDTPQGRALIAALLESADLIIDGTDAGLGAWGPELAPWHLETNPAAPAPAGAAGLVVRVSPFGAWGPQAHYRANDLLIHAASGLTFISGVPGQEPVMAPGDQGMVCAGLHAAIGALALLWERVGGAAGPLRGEAAAVEALAAMELQVAYRSRQGTIPQRTGSQHRTAVPGRIYRCFDGYVHIMVSDAQPGSWERFVAWMGSPEALLDPDYQNSLYRRKHVGAVDAVVAPYLESLTQEEIFTSLEAVHVPCAPVYSPGQALADRQSVARGLATTDAAGGPALRPPFLWDGEPVRPAPLRPAGFDTAALLRELGLGEDAITALYEAGIGGEGR